MARGLSAVKSETTPLRMRRPCYRGLGRSKHVVHRLVMTNLCEGYTDKGVSEKTMMSMSDSRDWCGRLVSRFA
jgi:hypothetical protein